MRIELWAQADAGGDRFIQFTEGVMPEEEVGERTGCGEAVVDGAGTSIELANPGGAFRLGASWALKRAST